MKKEIANLKLCAEAEISTWPLNFEFNFYSAHAQA